MKIAVFADSHADSTVLFSAVEWEKPDAVIHLGDHIEDGGALFHCFPGLQIHLVRGNTDSASGGIDEALLTLEGMRVFLTHGHLYGVKNGVYEIARKGREVGADIVLFGHTHRPFVTYSEGLWLMNPGCAGQKGDKAGHATYGLLQIERGRIAATLVEALA